jgi:ubiquinone biosynthesis protein
VDAKPLRIIRSLGRSREIATVLLAQGFGDLVVRLGMKRPLQWGRRVFLRQSRRESEREISRGERIRVALETLGPTFVKFGQVLSTRPDLIPADVLAELGRLQEQVPPFDSGTALATIRAELGRPAEQLFAEFDPVPVAAGSLGQVHRARHKDGTPLAVKIRRPRVVHEVERDLELMHELALLADRHIPEAEVFDPVGLVNQFARTIRREMNFAREARTIEEFTRLFKNDATLHVPRVFPELGTEAVVTMEFVEGLRIDDRAEFAVRGIDPHALAVNGAAIFMKQAFELGVFHGDPHPGNVRVMEDGAICLLDYGMIGTLEDELRVHLVDLFVAVTRRDVPRTVELVCRIGRSSRPVDLHLLRADVRDFIETYYGVPLDRLDVGGMLRAFVNILAIHRIRCSGDLMLLIRALVTLEGVGRSLDPAFNLAEQLAPFVTRVVRDRWSPPRLAAQATAEAGRLLHLAHELPFHVGRTFEKLGNDDLRVKLDHGGLEHLITEVDRSSNRVVIGVVVAALIVSSAMIVATSTDHSSWFSAPIFVLSSFLGTWLIYGIFRSGRL